MAGPVPTTREATIRILQSAGASRWLADPASLAAWAELGSVGSSGTVSRHQPFVVTWRRAYRDIKEPDIAVPTDGDHRLGGLLLLAPSST